MKQNIENWKKLKFGIFVHWGLYSIRGVGEWGMFMDPVDKDEYSTLKDKFTAENFDAQKWAQTAKDAGAKYMVMTTRHHDGFSLWDSKASVGNFTSMNSAAKKDFVAEYINACRENELKVGLYYSPMDWRFEGFFLPRMYHKSALQMKEQCHSQVRELLSNYGKIDILWYDGGEDYWLGHGKNLHNLGNECPEDFREHPQIPNFWEADKLDKMARELQPDMIINNRTGARQYGDYTTPEGRVGEFNLQTPWETCDTLTRSWGWVPNQRVRSLRNIINLLVRVVTGGGNLLLNVGPRPDGAMEVEQVTRLRQVGAWLEKYGESIYDTDGGPIMNGEWGGATWKENKLFIHVLDWEKDNVYLPKLDSNIVRVWSMTAENVDWKEEGETIRFTVSAEDKNAPDTIIVVEYDKNVGEAYKYFDPTKFGQTSNYVSEALIVEQM